MDKHRVAERLIALAEALTADVGDVEVVEPVGSTPVKTKKTKKAMPLERLPVSEGWKSGVLSDMEEVMTEGMGADDIEYSAFLTNTRGTSNKFHYFVVFRYQQADGTIVYVGGNAYGRIGKTAKVMVIARAKRPQAVLSMVQRKQRQKESKGYD